MRHGNTVRRALLLVLSCHVLAACILLPEFGEFDSVIDSCVQDNPEVPPHCRGTCDGSEIAGASCTMPGQLCTREFDNDCIYQAKCSEYRVWQAMVFCPKVDAGAADAAQDGDQPPHCLKCSDFNFNVNTSAYCEASQAIWDALRTCLCERSSMDPIPGCKHLCMENICAGQEITPNCSTCAASLFCVNEIAACSEDF